MSFHYINPDKIREILFNEPKYVSEFCEAGVTSFEEFIDHFRTHLLNRNIEDLRKAGHKIKPGAQMMGATEVVEEYINARELLEKQAEDERLDRSVRKMEEICSTIQKELNQLARSPN